ncbi:RNA polymerase sigma-70 factor, ECF subfamily [Lachnospiraceae bacterium KM106-2]|nr:RNA polymerase sigma-70 factor, ECF subfamily [Lachnospiraceae bacterium KM106-2]
MEDAFLIAAAKQGNKKRLDELITKYYEKIYHYCYRHTDDRTMAEDLTQEVFLKVIRNINGYSHYGKFENYLYVIAGNVCKDFYKQKVFVSMEEVATEEGKEERSYDRIENSLVVKEALDSLNEKEREAIILRYYQDLKIKDIAKIMGDGVSITKYRLGHAKKLLKKYMKGEKS